MKSTGLLPFNEMQHHLVMSLAGDHLILELVSVETVGLAGALRGLFQRHLSGEGNRSPIARVEVSGKIAAGTLAPILGQALSGLQSLHAEPLAGMPLEVQLGLDHARIGLVDLSGVMPNALSAKQCQTYAHAWVAQMLHLDPSATVIRWELLEHSRKLLVSCVDRQVVDSVTEFSLQTGLRFSSCRPAVLSVLNRYQARNESALDRTLVWIEASAGGGRSPKIQLLRQQGRHLAALWRGWVPEARPGGGKDEALDEAVGRFQRVNTAGSAAAIEHLAWPVPAAAGILT
jgi:hypothetical protein